MKIYTIIGNVASGKSTILPLVAKAVGGRPVDADTLFQVSPFRDEFLSDMKRWAFANELWMTYERSKLLAQLPRKTPTPLVIDSGLPMNWVYTNSHLQEGIMSQNEWDLFEQLFVSLSGKWMTKSVIIEIATPLDLLMERILKRGREYELALYTMRYLKQLEKGLAAFRSSFFHKTAGWVKFSSEELGTVSDNSIDTKRILSVLQEKIKKTV